tara:strand:+ start:328 stop:534 length:207 start_codon:yes stop_codon:yes gene_type:complete
MIVGTSKWKVTLDENTYQESLKGLELKELNKLLRNRKACMNKKKKVFVEMREIFQKQIDIIEEFINKI